MQKSILYIVVWLICGITGNVIVINEMQKKKTNPNFLFLPHTLDKLCVWLQFLWLHNSYWNILK